MNILICGAGALGAHFTYLARDLDPDTQLSVIDFDRVETKNLASQWFVKPMIGKNKATALKMQWQNFYGRKLKDYTVRLVEENIETVFFNHDLIIDCFDNAESRQLVQDYVRANGIACLHGGLAANGEFGVVRWDADFVIDSEDVIGQATCEGTGFLPLILAVSGALVASVQAYQADSTQFKNWNISAQAAESF